MRKRSNYKILAVLLLCFLIVFSFFYFSSTMVRMRSKNEEAIGAIAESSEELAKAITREIPLKGPPKRILEVGAGTGVFTEKIIEKMTDKDHVDVVELMPELCQILDGKFKHLKNVTIFCGDILDWKPSYRYPYIISGLPFNSFSEDLVRKITQHLLELAEPGALYSFFEYKWLPHLRPLVMSSDRKAKYKATRDAIEELIEHYEFSKESVYINLPPATVHFLKINK